MIPDRNADEKLPLPATDSIKIRVITYLANTRSWDLVLYMGHPVTVLQGGGWPVAKTERDLRFLSLS